MKNRIIFSIIAILAVLPSVSRAQQDIYPTFVSPQPMHIVFNTHVDSTIAVALDEGQIFICDSLLAYEVLASFPSSDTVIADIGGNQTAARNTPTSSLCCLLKAYHSISTTNYANLLACYTTSSANDIASVMNVDSLRTKVISYLSTIDSMRVLMCVEINSNLFILVAPYIGGVRQTVTPYAMSQVNNQWYVAAASFSSGLLFNMMNFLSNHVPSELIFDSDLDNDGIDNLQDNCPCTSNPDQGDRDNDGKGDACDNCPFNYNPLQEDYDGDGTGNVCDNCPASYNPAQTDSDHDGIGDSCDNCQTVYNPYQLDYDLDSIGNECDPDIDNDSIPNQLDTDMDGDGVDNDVDNCPMTFNPGQYDTDEDGIGDICDNCPEDANANQTDTDGDGEGDVCDSDIDGDSIPNVEDNCPYSYNPNQEDLDCDGIGDACDDDIDGDGIPNNDDNCPLIFNPDQTDVNGNGVGDVCE